MLLPDSRFLNSGGVCDLGGIFICSLPMEKEDAAVALGVFGECCDSFLFANSHHSLLLDHSRSLFSLAVRDQRSA